MEKDIARSGERRNSSFELLRILSILMIILHHLVFHGGMQLRPAGISIPQIWSALVMPGGKIGVNCFVLISGYFLSARAHATLSLNRLLKMLGEIVFYSIALYLALCALNRSALQPRQLIRSFFPIRFNTWWFASAYFIMYLLHPALNRLIHALSRRTYQNLLIGLILLWSIIPLFTLGDYDLSGLLWFFVLYLLGGYIRRYDLNPKFTRRHYAIALAAILFTWFAVCMLLFCISARFPFASDIVTRLRNAPNNPFILFSALSLFMLFQKTHIQSSRCINAIASTTFGVYLIHDYAPMRDLLWNRILNIAAYQDTAAIISYSLLAAAGIFLLCAAIDLLRKALLEKPFLCIVDRCAAKCQKPFQAAIRFMQNLLFGAISESEQD